MAYNELLAERIGNELDLQGVEYRAMKMMGGWCAMVDEKMCVGIVREELMARIGPDNYEEALEKDGVREMNFTGRSMKGYVFIDAEAIESDEQLAYWVARCIAFNPLAKASKKKKKS